MDGIARATHAHTPFTVAPKKRVGQSYTAEANRGSFARHNGSPSSDIAKVDGQSASLFSLGA
jgi:hypothetical protein